MVFQLLRWASDESHQSYLPFSNPKKFLVIHRLFLSKYSESISHQILLKTEYSTPCSRESHLIEGTPPLFFAHLFYDSLHLLHLTRPATVLGQYRKEYIPSMTGKHNFKKSYLGNKTKHSSQAFCMYSRKKALTKKIEANKQWPPYWYSASSACSK